MRLACQAFHVRQISTGFLRVWRQSVEFMFPISSKDSGEFVSILDTPVIIKQTSNWRAYLCSCICVFSINPAICISANILFNWNSSTEDCLIYYTHPLSSLWFPKVCIHLLCVHWEIDCFCSHWRQGICCGFRILTKLDTQKNLLSQCFQAYQRITI